MPLQHLEHFLIQTEDLESTKDWFVDVLGMKQFTDDAVKRPNEIIFSSSGLYVALGTRARPLCRSRPRRDAHCASSSSPAAMRHQARAECWRSVSYSAR
jgi:hypothetical protein